MMRQNPKYITGLFILALSYFSLNSMQNSSFSIKNALPNAVRFKYQTTIKNGIEFSVGDYYDATCSNSSWDDPEKWALIQPNETKAWHPLGLDGNIRFYIADTSNKLALLFAVKKANTYSIVPAQEKKFMVVDHEGTLFVGDAIKS